MNDTAKLMITDDLKEDTLDVLNQIGEQVAYGLDTIRADHPLRVARFVRDVISHDVIWLKSKLMRQFVTLVLDDVVEAKHINERELKSLLEHGGKKKEDIIRMEATTSIIEELMEAEGRIKDYLGSYKN
jgi:hypothetical protein